MITNYDPIAEQYKRSKEQPWRTFIECFTLQELIGDLRGLAVLDVACGEGFYTRLLRQRGAARVLGVDLSPGMIELARRQESEQRLGIEYVVGDARALPTTGEFDLVVAAYLLNYARSRDELRSMCGGIARSLKPGGRFVTVNCNPALAFPTAPCYRRYGFETGVQGAWQEGAPIKWTFYLSEGTFDIENYHLDVAIHEEAFRQSDFREIRWHAPRLSPEGLLSHDRDFWSIFLDHPPVAFIECLK
ncbi:MAG TPA: class I SAM-dependent methyltransferase [Pirellulales bacterium]|jgi:ubiquinone/menaquinone biosynthesis C-methylase UbiE|nr:class I SAM-dependent methyltransferase [Pirellulales bacterium]